MSALDESRTCSVPVSEPGSGWKRPMFTTSVDFSLPEDDVAVDRDEAGREEDVRIGGGRALVGAEDERERLGRLDARDRVRRQAGDERAVRRGAGDGDVARELRLDRPVEDGERARPDTGGVGRPVGLRVVEEQRLAVARVVRGDAGGDRRQRSRQEAVVDVRRRRGSDRRRVLRDTGEAVERQAVHVRLDHHLLVGDVVVARGGVVLVQRAHPLLADRAARVEVAREPAHQALGEVDRLRVAVAEAGVREVHVRPGLAVRLRPVELALGVGRARSGRRPCRGRSGRCGTRS